MKVTSTISPMPVREPVRPAGAGKPFVLAETPAATAQPASVPTKTVPSGLQRVLETLQDIPVASLTRGQANAMQHIERNIARYRDNHGIAAPATTPPDPAPGDPAVTPTPVETPETPVAADPVESAPQTPVAAEPAETPPAPVTAETPAETPVAAPEAPVAGPIAELPSEVPSDPVVAAEPAAIEVPVDTPTADPAVEPTLVATPQLPPLEASLLEALPPAGSMIDMQA